MLPNFELTIAAIVDAIAKQGATPEPRTESINAVSQFLINTHAKMPDYMRLPFRLLTLLFDAWSIPARGRPFHLLELSGRMQQIQLWESSRLDFFRGLLAFYRSLATFGLYSEFYGEDHKSDVLDE